MEELLNKLLKKWWRPRNRKKTLHISVYDWDLNVYLDWWYLNENKKSFRELVSKESWLWEFCVQNNLVEIKRENIWLRSEYFTDYEVCIMRSALRDEVDLESFILDNIKID